MKKPRVFHPFLLALFPVLFLLSKNMDHFLWSEVLRPALYVLGGAFAVRGGFRLLTKDSLKGALAASLFLAVFFSYGHLCSIATGGDDWHAYDSIPFFILCDLLVIFIIGFALIMQTRRSLSTLTEFLNVTSLSLVIFSCVLIGQHLFQEEAAKRSIIQGEGEKRAAAASAETSFSSRPDIYYIILDAYGRADTLEEVFNYPNAEFLSFLRTRGFFVADGSFSNYGYTIASLGSSLNISYINDYVENDFLALNQMVSDSMVRRTLESYRYTYLSFTPDVSLSFEAPRYLDVYLDFTTLLLGTTMARATVEQPQGDRLYETFRQRFLNIFEEVAQVPRNPRPTFTFVHILALHPPYLFGRRGERIPITTAELVKYSWLPKERYLDQLVFVNRKVRRLVELILSRSETPPIIVIQGDHGPDFGNEWSNDPAPHFLRQRMRILNAYFLPEKGKKLLYDSISPVNTFRVILNSSFGARWALVEDRCYYSLPYKRSKVIDVTDEVK